jgi:cytochrome P450
MVKHPDVVRRIRAEVNQLLSREPVPDYRGIESLHYLNNFTWEVLRLLCPAIHSPREAAEDVVVQGVSIPKGATILLYPAIVQHNPVIWGPDRDEFNPDRWDRLEGEAADPQAFAAFGQGPRVCVGKIMSLIEFKIIMIELVSKFEFEALENIETEAIELVNPSPLLRPKGGLKVRVKRLG